MALPEVLDALMKKTGDLQTSFDFTWKHPDTAPLDPVHAPIDPEWPAWDPAQTAALKKNGPNWFYTELVFPEEKDGVALAGTDARIYINGYSPFTLWLDGEEMFREVHAWKATGPIADPIPFPIDLGSSHRLVVCLEPTELPALAGLLVVGVHSAACQDMAIETGALFAQLKIAEGIAKTPGDASLLERAASVFDLDALARNDWPEALISIAAVEQVLAPFSERAREMTLHLIGHTHIDMDWMWTWKDTVYCIRRDFKAVTDLQDDYPDLTFTLSQVPSYKVVEEMDPDIFAKVKARIKEGRWENVAGTWVEGDLNMADGESIARHMLYAKDWTREHLGTESRTMWEPDTFGHPGNMPQLARLGEMDGYFQWRCNPGREKNWPVRKWEGIDGSSVTSFSTAYGSGLQPDHVIWNILNYQQFGLKNALHVWGLGDHGGGLSRVQIRALERYRNKPVMPQFRFSTMRQLLEAIQAEGSPLPHNIGETYSLFEGCFTTHSQIKRYNRECEGALLAAEAFSVLAGIDRNDILRDGWTGVLFNHFHDIMDGAAVHDSYENAFARAEHAVQVSRQVSQEAIGRLASQSPDGRTLIVLNPLGFERTEPVRVSLPEDTTHLVDGDGVIVPVQKLEGLFVLIGLKIPALSSKSYTIVSRAVDPEEEVVGVKEEGDTFRVETAFASARISKTSGAIGSYFDKRLEKEFVPYGVPKHLTHIPTTRADLSMNVFQVLDEAPNAMSAWLINDILKEENLLRGAEVSLVETGPVFARFRVKHHFRSSAIEEDVIFYRDFPRVDFEARIDWREKGSPEVGVPQLKVSMGSVVTSARARFEGPFCITERPADGQEQPTQKWTDVSGDHAGFTIYNDCRYGCDVLGGRMRLTLLRNPYGPDPETDNGEHTVRFAFAPHGGRVSNADLVRAGMAFNRPVEALRTAKPAATGRPLFTLEGGESLVCTAFRRPEHSPGLLIRFFEANGSPCKVELRMNRPTGFVRAVNFLENPVEDTIEQHDGAILLSFRPFEVKTIILRPEK